jgi:hypothetical protein
LGSLNKESLKKFHFSCVEFDGDSKDALLIGLLSAFTDFNSNYSHDRLFNVPVCKKPYLKIVGISEKVMKNIKAQMKEGNYNARVHGNTNNLFNCSSVQQTEEVVNFITAKSHEVGNPYPVSRKSEIPKIVLPCDCSKKKMYDDYKVLSPNPVSVTTFKKFWKEHVSHVVIGKPRYDVCAKCEEFKNNLKTCEPNLRMSLQNEYDNHKHCYTLSRQDYNLLRT